MDPQPPVLPLPLPSYPVVHVPPETLDLSHHYMIVGILGCLFWAASYLFAIVENYRKKTYTFPASTICLNWTWEFLTAFRVPDPLPIWHVLEILWFLTDVPMVVQTFLYGPRRQTIPELRRFWPLLMVIGLAFAGLGQWTFVLQYQDALVFVDGFLINAWMSLAFIILFFQRRATGDGLNKGVAWTKMLGTMCTGYEAAFLIRAFNPSLQTSAFFWFLWITIFLLDAVYVWLLYHPWPLGKPEEIP
jgi:hypothetical protein